VVLVASRLKREDQRTVHSPQGRFRA